MDRREYRVLGVGQTADQIHAGDQAGRIGSGYRQVPGAAGVGDEVAYRLALRNVGNVTVTGIDLRDDRGDVALGDITWPGPVGQLAPGETATATATYEITQADVDAGEVINTASADGPRPAGPPRDGEQRWGAPFPPKRLRPPSR